MLKTTRDMVMPTAITDRRHLMRGDVALLPTLSRRKVRATASANASFETRPYGRSSG
jgi:hypothetical protein